VPNPRTEAPAPSAAPWTPAQPVVEAPAPVQTEVPRRHAAPPPLTTRPTNPVPQQPQPQPQAEQPITGTLPQSGAGATGGGNQIPEGTLPHVMRPPTTTTSLVSTEQLDTPRTMRAEEPTFSPD
jgi:hypothetical protein